MKGGFKSRLDYVESILSENSYMSLATVDNECKPWSSVVFYAYDEKNVIYFISAIDSRHAINMRSNKNVSAIIYDSHQKIGMTEEIKIVGTAELVEETELKKAVKIYSDRIKSKSSGESIDTDYRIDSYTGAAEFRFFKIKIENMYVNEDGRSVDVDLG